MKTLRTEAPIPSSEPLVVRSRGWGWWVDGLWCPTENIRDHCIAKRKAGKLRGAMYFPLTVAGVAGWFIAEKFL